MPSGKIHGRATLYLAATTAVVGPWVAMVFRPVSMPYVLAVVAGQFTGLVVEPDLDVDFRTASERRLQRALMGPGRRLCKSGHPFIGAALTALGFLVGWLWVIIWLPYALLVPHRGISHWFMIGTLTRVGWMASVLVVFWWIYRPVVPSDVWGYLASWFVGLTMSDTLHIIMDRAN